MCGIHVSISTNGTQSPSQDLQDLLCNRGPDHLGHAQDQVHAQNDTTVSLSFTSTVLALRGGRVTHQPFTDVGSGSVLCWNGEAWKIGQEPVVGNDGEAVFDLLVRASTSHKDAEATTAVLQVLKSISGPFAFVYFDKSHDQIYFGRDRLGRRSLLYCSDGHSGSFQLASISDPSRGTWKEVEADAIYILSCSGTGSTMPSILPEDDLVTESVLPVYKQLWPKIDPNPLMPCTGLFNRNIPSQQYWLNVKSTSVSNLRYELLESLKLRVQNVLVPPGPEYSTKVRVAILFSGGLDCTVLARLAHDILPLEQEIDLLNVAFENPRVIRAAQNPPKQKKQAIKQSKIHPCQDQASTTEDVAAESFKQTSPFESCPDRGTGRKSFQELQDVCPGRTWRFVAVDVPFTETILHRDKVVSLIRPHNTEMDLSIANALYFAARGTGNATSSHHSETVMYRTPARVLLSGLGADELFGGYTRHVTAFNRNGFLGLLDELELDVNRLGKRNLGRDDRVISHWGREARFPFLDESLVKWAVELPIMEKCGFTSMSSEVAESPEIEPGKKVLRLLAYELGMHSVAQEKKRAIQFGARTAKMEIGGTKGTALIS